MSVIPTRDQVPQIVRSVSSRHRPTVTPGTGITGRDILRIMRKRKWLIILTVLIFTVGTFVATLIWSIYAPFYTAEAILAVEPPKARDPFSGTPIYGTEIINRLTQQHVQMLKRDPILNRALDNPRVKDTRWFQQIPAQDVLNRLYEEINVGHIPNTNFFRVTMTGIGRSDEDRRALAEIVRAVSDAFIDQTRETSSRGVNDQITKLNEEKIQLVKRLKGVRDEIIKLRPADAPSLTERQNAQFMKMQALVRQLTELGPKVRRAFIGNEAIKTMPHNQIAQMPDVVFMLANDPDLRQLRIRLINMRSQEKNVSRKYGTQHRINLSFQSSLESVKNEIKIREELVTDEQIVYLKQMRELQWSGLNGEYEALKKDYEAETGRMKDIEKALARMRQADVEAKNLTRKIDRIDNSLLELRVLSRTERTVWLASPPSQPREPSMPQWKIMMPLGIVLGMIVGFGGAFLLEFIDTSIKSPTDISRRMDLPMLGVIPHTDDLEEEIEDLRLAFLTDPDSLIAESFRQIRTCLLFSGPASQRRSLLVTSPLPGDGRTTVALNLGATMAHGGRKVLVVDANFRQPMIRKLFSQCGEAGFSDALVGQANWRDLVSRVEGNFHVLSSGPMPPNPAEILGSDQMREFLAETTAEYDQVIFDGAPCLVVTDSTILSTMVDGVVLTVRAGANTFGILQRTRDMLVRVGAHILGVALNGIRVTAGGYLRENYETFYEYREQASLPPE